MWAIIVWGIFLPGSILTWNWSFFDTVATLYLISLPRSSLNKHSAHPHQVSWSFLRRAVPAAQRKDNTRVGIAKRTNGNLNWSVVTLFYEKTIHCSRCFTCSCTRTRTFAMHVLIKNYICEVIALLSAAANNTSWDNFLENKKFS